MEPGVGLGVGQVARLAGVSVRTLHHYDEIGLLRPSERTASGYRRYGEDDLDRLQRILGYRTLGFGLEEIRAVLADGDDSEHLRRQHRLIEARIARLRELATLIETTMEARAMGIRLTPEEMFEVFGDDDPTQDAEEAEERWGDSEAYRESQRRTATYTKQDWLTIRAEARAATERYASVMAAGLLATGPEAMDAAEAHRQHITRWFYDLPREAHVGLAQMYVADPRFARHYEEVAPGLAEFVHDAIVANAARG